MALADIFKALGDPVRLEMVQRLSDGIPCTISSLSHGLGLTRQGARKHLQVLVNAGMVALIPKGRDVLVLLDPMALTAVNMYVSEVERRWDTRLNALRSFTEAEC